MQKGSISIQMKNWPAADSTSQSKSVNKTIESHKLKYRKVLTGLTSGTCCMWYPHPMLFLNLVSYFFTPKTLNSHTV